MKSGELAKLVREEAMELQEEMEKHQMRLHKHPEAGFELKETCEYVYHQLEEMGYRPKRVGKAGITALLESSRPGPTFLLRADMDALPIAEENDDKDKSENGYMHACGHDFHTAMLLGAAKILQKHREELCGNVKLMFQPAEELLEGAKDMIRDGVLEDPQVDSALMIHVLTGLPLDTGTCIVSAPGASAPAADYFTIEVKGKGCHGSSPNTGIDPLTAAAHILIALQEIKARELGAAEAAVLTIGSFHGGEAANIIPDKVVLEGTLRAFGEELRSYLHKRIVEITGDIAKAFRAKAEVKFGSGCPTLVNEKELSEAVKSSLEELLGHDKCFGSDSLARQSNGGNGRNIGMSGSEDFAYISHRVPSVMVALVAGSLSQGYVYPLHHPKVRFDRQALSVGAAVYAYSAISRLGSFEK